MHVSMQFNRNSSFSCCNTFQFLKMASIHETKIKPVATETTSN